MKKILLFLFVIVGILGASFAYRYFVPQPNEKVYVAVEGESKIVAFDPATKKIVSTIDLSVEHEGGRLPYAPHNVQVSPDNKTVWVTANAGKHEDHDSHGFFGVSRTYAHGEEEEGEEADEIIVINPKTDRIIKRIPIASGIHLAHIVLRPDGTAAYATAQKEGAIYGIASQTYEIIKRIPLSEGGEPHGIRIASDGEVSYIAMLGNKSLGILDLKTDAFSEVPLGGQAVQTGVTPDGKIAVASLYDTKQLAVYRVDTKEVKYIRLPASAKGPIQMYPTPDSSFIYLADQGYYFGEPSSEWVYKIDLEKFEVVKEIKAGKGPHGVAISEDGARVYVTNLLSGDVSIINTTTDKEISRVKVGKDPNGISVWVKR